MITVKGITSIAGIAVFGAVSTIVLAPHASADALYGAIAYSNNNGVIGASRNQPSREAAEARAMRECVDRPPEQPEHPSQCKVVTQGAASCFALAVGPQVTYFSAGTGATTEEAQAEAMVHSSAGWIILEFCHSGGAPEGLSAEA